MNSFKNKNVLVYGLGKSGIAVYDLLKKLKAKVYTFDEFKFPKKELNIDLKSLDLAVISPGVPKNTQVYQNLLLSDVKMISEVEFASCFLKGEIISITGTNGKTTTVSLLGEIFKNQYGKKKVFVAGNIGLPISKVATKTKPKTNSILELSSFQLELIENFHSNIAVVLNLAPDHLDRYENFEEYISAKFNIFKNLKDDDKVVLNYNDKILKTLDIPNTFYFSINNEEDNASFCGVFLKDKNVFFKNDEVEYLLNINDIKLLGEKNIENILAAVLVAKLKNLDMKKVQESINNFLPLANRLEIVKKEGSITYINDSKATNVASAISDINAIKQSFVLILGGSDKGEDFLPLAENLSNNKFVKQIVVSGQTKQKIAEALEKCNLNFEVAKSFKAAVLYAIDFAKNFGGEISVLLAPACASFDEFSSYNERGQAFKKYVFEGEK